MKFLGKDEWYAASLETHGISVWISWGNRVEICSQDVYNQFTTPIQASELVESPKQKAAPKSGFSR
jgi:hypothetical protein